MFQTEIIEKIKTHFVFGTFFSKTIPFMRKCGKNTVEWGTPQMKVWRMHIACWIPKATYTHTHTHSICVIFIYFPLQQWLNEHASISTYTYVACLVLLKAAVRAVTI